MNPEINSHLAEELAVVYDEQSVRQVVPKLESIVGRVHSAERVSGGYVHYVFKIDGEEKTAYLKARSNHFARLPHIETDPARIHEEYKALMIYLQLCAEFFPQVLHFDDEFHYLLLTELLPGTPTLEQRFLYGKISLSEITTLGASLGAIHIATAHIQEPIRPDGDVAFKENLFKYVIEYPEHPELLATAKEHRARKTQLLIGDSSPKNVFLRDNQVGYCDLEGSHQGSIVYDQAFMLAHLLLHQDDQQGAQAAVEYFAAGYSSEGGVLDFQDKLLPQTIQAVLLYRLDNPLIPYNLNRDKEDRKRTAMRIYDSLREETPDIEKLIHLLIPE